MLPRTLFGILLAVAALVAAPAPTSAPSFHVTVTGQGRPMILIPGLSSSGHVWDDTVEHYQSRFQCHVLTLAGFAGEPAIPAPFLDTVRRDLAAYIRKNHLEKPVVVGHSLGGFLALWLASTEPDLPGPLVIVDSLPFFGAMQGELPMEKRKEQAEMLRKMIGGETREQYMAYIKSSKTLETMVTGEADLARVTEWSMTTDPKAVGEALYDMSTTDLRDDVARIKTPALVIGSWVGMKAMTTRDQVEKTFHEQYAKMKQVQFVLNDKAKHFIMLDDREGFFAAVDQFLSKK